MVGLDGHATAAHLCLMTCHWLLHGCMWALVSEMCAVYTAVVLQHATLAANCVPASLAGCHLQHRGLQEAHPTLYIKHHRLTQVQT